MKKKIKLFISVIVGILLVTITCYNCFASSSPVAKLYYYNHPNIPGLDAINTSSRAYDTEMQIDAAGYGCNYYINAPAGSAGVIGSIDECAVFFISAHGNPGRMYCVDSNNNMTIVSAKAHPSDYVYSLEYNFDDLAAKLKTVKIAYWMGCQTYGTSDEFGSLNTKCTSLGVDCNITHNAKTWSYYSDNLLYAFAFYGNQGQSVSTAMLNAKTWCLNTLGSSDELTTTVNGYILRGPSGYSAVTMEPARYGIYDSPIS